MKYVIGKNSVGQYVAVTFDDVLVHADIGKALQRSQVQPVHAGFWSRGADGNFRAYGESETLKLKADPLLDTAILLLHREGLNGLDLMNQLAFLEIQIMKGARL